MDRRTVRFRDFLPSRIEEQLKPAPMFSPSSTNAVVDHHQPVLPFMAAMSENADSHEFKENFSPPIKLNLRSNYQTPKMHFSSATMSTLAADDNELFFSPRTTLSSSAAGTPFSFITRSSNASFKTLPKIEMMSYDFIQHCTSESNLQQIVEVLAADRKYPSLLCAAQTRLRAIRQQNIAVDTASPQSQSTLRMSLSVDDDDDDNDNINVKLSPYDEIYTQQQYQKSNVAQSQYVTPTPFPQHIQISSRKDAPSHGNGSNEKENQLSEEVERLTLKLKQVETAQSREQADFWCKIQVLRESKAETDRVVAALKDDLGTTNAAKKELFSVLEGLQQQNEQLKQGLTALQMQHERTNKRATDLEHRLSAKIKELESELSKNRIASRKNYQTDQLLKSAHRNLNEIKQERDAVLTAIIDASGTDIQDLSKLSKEERKQLIADFRTQSAVSKTALQAMAETLKVTELDKRKSETNCRQVQLWLKESEKKCCRLERDKFDYAREINRLSHELSEYRVYNDQLMKSAQTCNEKEWKEQEEKYKAVIASLKNQLRKEETAVPISLYREAVEQRNDLKKEIIQIRQQLQQQQRSPFERADTLNRHNEQSFGEGYLSQRPPWLDDNFSRENIAPNQYDNFGPMLNLANGSSRTLSGAKQKTLKSDEQIKLKMEMVRATGGVKALQKKVQRHTGKSPSTPQTAMKNSRTLQIKN